MDHNVGRTALVSPRETEVEQYCQVRCWHLSDVPRHSDDFR
jgi:hypothetical protein